MTLQEKIRNDMVSAMKNRNTETVSLLRVVAGEFGRIGKDLTDEQCIKVIRKMSGNAVELGNLNEFKILDEYLPKMYGESDIRILVENIIVHTDATSMKDMGMVMSKIKEHPNSPLIDGKISSQIVREILSQK